jgi:hypothetical protein
MMLHIMFFFRDAALTYVNQLEPVYHLFTMIVQDGAWD